jgi:tetratricopeptide (TPR) repeat protein
MNLKSIFAALVLLVAAHTAALAQGSQITNGVLSFQDGDFAQAARDLREATANPAALNEKQAPKAYSYLGRAYAQLYSKTRGDKNSPIAQEFPDLGTKAYKAFMEAEKTDSKGTFVKENKRFYPLVTEALYIEGFDAYSAQKNAEALAALNNAVNLIEKNRAEVPALANLYGAYMVRGFVHNADGRKKQAITDFETALRLYAEVKATLPKPDDNVASIYENLIFLYSEEEATVNKALEYVEKGKAEFPGNEKIERLELQVYQKYPDFFSKGLARFEEALAKNPNDVTLLINYGTMLEKTDTLKAIQMYMRAATAEPNNFIANYNLGGAWIIWAKKYQDLAAKTTKSAELQKLEAEIEKALTEALKYMRKASELQPDNLTAARAAWQIAANLEHPDEEKLRMKYKSLEK